MLMTKAQMSVMLLLKGGKTIKMTDVNTLTLASMMRRGLVRIKFKRLGLTELGKKVYEWNMRRRIRSWKEELARARDMKRRAA